MSGCWGCHLVKDFNHNTDLLFKIGLINSSSCWKCKKEMGTFLHLIWECPLVEPFWHSVLKFLETWAGVALPVSPRLCLLGDKTETPTLTKRASALMYTIQKQPSSSMKNSSILISTVYWKLN
uniref:Reverse transcriptase zinc-binding domain-containing protein n=1 Tax=Pygocentrus nattereri TaxID=42514 RepID=A0AAR2L0B7_PYGNA